MNSATNCGPLSDMTLRGRPWCFQTLSKYNLAEPMAETVVTVSTKCPLLVTVSTTTMTESLPSDSGSSTMKSTLMVSQGSSGMGSGCSSPTGGARSALVRRHISQVEVYFPMYLDI